MDRTPQRLFQVQMAGVALARIGSEAIMATAIGRVTLWSIVVVVAIVAIALMLVSR